MNYFVYKSLNMKNSNDHQAKLNRSEHLLLDYSQFILRFRNIRVERKPEKTARELNSLGSFLEFSFRNTDITCSN